MKNIVTLFFATLMWLGASAQSDEQFYHPSRQVTQPQGLSFREIFIPTQGDTLSTIFIDAEGKAKATVLFFHGNALNMWQSLDMVKPLVGSGYNVMMWDYRGFGKSTGTPTHMNIAQDAQLVFDEMMRIDKAAGLPVLLYGSSIGGQSATLVAKNNNGKVDALVLDGVVKSFTALALTSAPEQYHDVIRQYVTSPYSIEADLPHAGNVRLLLIHSKQDFVPYEGAVELYGSATQEKDFWTFEGPHIQAGRLYPEELVERIDRLLEH